jgi:hypothetical protein
VTRSRRASLQRPSPPLLVLEVFFSTILLIRSTFGLDLYTPFLHFFSTPLLSSHVTNVFLTEKAPLAHVLQISYVSWNWRDWYSRITRVGWIVRCDIFWIVWIISGMVESSYFSDGLGGLGVLLWLNQCHILAQA